MVKCALRGMQGKFDLDPDVVMGKQAQHTLHFTNPFKKQMPADEAAPGPQPPQNHLGPPLRGRAGSTPESDVSENTDESICMDYIDLESL